MGEVEPAVGAIVVFAEEVSPGLADSLAATVRMNGDDKVSQSYSIRGAS